MITPEIKYPLEYLNVPDSDEEEDFFVSVTAAIGPKEEEGADLFYLYIVSPMRLEKMGKTKGLIQGKDKFILNKFSRELVEQELSNIIIRCKRNTWEETAQALNRFLFWEYDKR
ncbi:Imm8 family immunity protein [Paenibacillus oleatilyticus]|uniref:Imm8 family immunity protein n=1 Tax=Paenibacillus oleatilyticus TaxID=2594886 RepID=A0ABV4VB70_9BACL